MRFIKFPKRSRQRPGRSYMTRLRVVRLEDRTVPSTNFLEVEPNNTTANANAVPLGFDTGEDSNVLVKGAIEPAGDRDWFRVELNKGDVIGGEVQGLSGLNPTVRLVDSAGALLVFNDDHGFISVNLPPESPLPKAFSRPTDSVFYYVIDTPGTYRIEVAASGDASTGKYQMKLAVARPGLEAQPVGTRQILFVDFDGATTKLGGGNPTLSPLSSSLPAWGLTSADENAVIDAILATIRENLSEDVRERGLNGDFAATGVPGQFDIEIRNSRDHADDFGRNPFVSRIIIGGTREEFGGNIVGRAEFIDPGNFSTDDDAVVLLDRLSGPASDPESLNRFDVAFSHTKVQLVGLGVGQVATHEAGHYFGNWHTDVSLTDPFAGAANIMDPARINLRAIGPDGIFGSDDVDVDLGVDLFFTGEVFRGTEDTLNAISIGLSTGKGTVGGASGGGGGGGGGSGYGFAGSDGRPDFARAAQFPPAPIGSRAGIAAPAAGVTPLGATLNIVGDAADDDVLIVGVGSGAMEVFQFDDARDDFVSVGTFVDIANITFDGSDGDDLLSIHDLDVWSARSG